jgi:3-oxoadipate enol-lactonase
MNHLTGMELKVRVRDRTISYDDLGSGQLPIIFIHGFPFDKSTWRNQIEVLSKNQRVIAYDIRGFGNSESGNEAFSMTLFARDLIEFMDVLKIDKAIVCGLSMGGYILLNALDMFPERFRAIILSDTQCIPDTSDVKTSRIKTIGLIEQGGKVEFADGFINKIFCKSTFEQRPDLINEIRDIIVKTPDESITRTLQALSERNEMCSMLTKVKLPVLILCGDSDVVTPLEQSRLMQSRIQNVTIHVLRNAGHLSNLEQPDDFNLLITRFAESLTG